MSIEEAVWYVAAAYAVVLAGVLALFASTARRADHLGRQVRELRRLAAHRAADPECDCAANRRVPPSRPEPHGPESRQNDDIVDDDGTC